MKKILILILFLFISNPVFASEIGGTLGTGYIGTRTIIDVGSSKMQNEVTSGLISVGSTNPASTPNFTFNVDYILKDGEAAVAVPAQTEVAKTGGGSIDLTTFTTTDNTLEISGVLDRVLGSIKVGIPDVNLTFSQPITVTIPVGTAHNSQTLTTYYRSEGSTVWAVETTCTVIDGNCTFQTSHATTFTAQGNAVSSGSSTSSNNSSSSGNSSPSCTDTKPSSTPDLFQINVTATTAKLFFTPISNTTSFYISFSTKPIAQEHGAQITLAREGVQNFTIKSLKPNTTYYFKVRGQNGCQTGDWSKIMKIKTSSKGVIKTSAFYKNTNIIKKIISKVVSVIKAPTPAKKCFFWWCF